MQIDVGPSKQTRTATASLEAVHITTCDAAGVVCTASEEKGTEQTTDDNIAVPTQRYLHDIDNIQQIHVYFKGGES